MDGAARRVRAFVVARARREVLQLLLVRWGLATLRDMTLPVNRFNALHDTRAFLQRFSNVDLARIRFPNPFIPGLRFSLATGVHVIAAHDRRHLWQAWNVRRAAEQRR